jgi:hypothetical protein
MSESQITKHCTCGITVGELVTGFSPDEGAGSLFDLAADFADDETYAVYVIHHEEAKFARQVLQTLANHIADLRDQAA